MKQFSKNFDEEKEVSPVRSLSAARTRPGRAAHHDSRRAGECHAHVVAPDDGDFWTGTVDPMQDIKDQNDVLDGKLEQVKSFLKEEIDLKIEDIKYQNAELRHMVTQLAAKLAHPMSSSSA